ncbi:RND superfamily putative drug exporter [Kribbella orskensis]|uniref:RND superfamily putative drug exporter n=1 Tax=Kribbella orskensis TaxID=2512216 RepID=A0ABY2BUX1_9ACTN|nr:MULTISPECIES: MMPL family transporter [Kribbella]TCN44202.1 RND superfamily putative drug exporter [Kribbella sp. VKM Ac-2500]TCO32020.1 RND superfamily putative drug exporter [Kribbella orskensis]
MTDTYLPDDRHTGAEPVRPGPLGRLARLSFRRRGMVLLAWLLGLGLAIGLSAGFGDENVNGASLPGSDSEQAQTLLNERFPAQAGDRVDVVVRADDVAGSQVRDRIEALLRQMDGMPHVAEVEDPYVTRTAVSPDGRTLVARVYLDVTNPNDMPVEDTGKLLAATDEAEGEGLEIALTGRAVQLAEAPQGSSTEMLGLLAAAVVLLITFGSLVAAGLPLVLAVGGLLVSSSLVGLVAAVVDVPDFAPLIGAMLGIAVGIDYALLMVTRFREWRAVGLDQEMATVATLDTAGRAVLVAGGTVLVSMGGLFAMGLSIMNGTAVVTMVAILVVMLAALTLFPALLGYLGGSIDRLRLPLGRRRVVRVSADGHVVPAVGWVRWSRLVQRHSALASAGAIALLVVLAVPFLGVQFAMPDAGNAPEDTSNRQGYDMLAEGFGPGTSGPLLVVADLGRAEGEMALKRLHAELQAAAGVAAVSPPVVNAAGDTALITVVPTTGPQDSATVDLVHSVRDTVIPAAVEDTGTQAHVGGRTATTIDVNSSIVDRLPYLIGGVVITSVLLLLVAFRSVVIAVTAAVMNLLSVAAAYGVLAFFLEGGWAGQLIGIDSPAPMAGYVPVIMFALLFGLSMDYEVFLISRMSETWVRTRDNGQAILTGLAGTGRVITAAATIMFLVFAAMIALDDVTIKSFGVGMAAAILVDATIVRMLLVPAVMRLLGRSNWWLPRPLERWVPNLHVEGRPDAYLSARDAETSTPAPAPAPVGS